MQLPYVMKTVELMDEHDAQHHLQGSQAASGPEVEQLKVLNSFSY